MKLILLFLYIPCLYSANFDKDVKPILEENCLSCHNSKKHKGNLNLETLPLAIQGGKNGPAIVKGNSIKSNLIKRIKLDSDHDDVMPPKKPFLTKSQIHILDKWIQAGAIWPNTTKLSVVKKNPPSNERKMKVDIQIPRKKLGHSILVVGQNLIKLVSNKNKVQWQYRAKGVRSIQYLANGNIIFLTNKALITEIDPQTNKVIFKYDARTNKESKVHAFQRLHKGITMIALNDRIIEVDKNGILLKDIKLATEPLKKIKTAKKSNTDSYLIIHENDNFVKEYNSQGKIIWEYEIPLFDTKNQKNSQQSSFKNSITNVLRLPNGNTMVATKSDNKLIEVTPKKEIVWRMKKNDLKNITLSSVTALQLMPNGNIIINNSQKNLGAPHIIEFTRDKQVVWSYQNSSNLDNDFSNAIITDAIEDISFYNNDVLPVLEKNCLKCHGHNDKEMKGGFWLGSRYDTLKGGDISGARVYNPKKIADSALLKHIHYFDKDHQMPPKGKRMSLAEIKIITEWVTRGIPFDPYKEKIATGALLTEINEKTKSFWAYSPFKQPISPAKSGPWGRNIIDDFIKHQLDMTKMTPNGQADKVTLLRRAYYDLIGLPPSRKQVEQFISNKDPKAYEKVIDELLASKHYGEKWARHWLDIVRFAETNSYEYDDPKPHAWKYRQWVINSFNKDKPYSQMIMEQLAGDELDNPTEESITATGYYRLGVWDIGPADKVQALYDEYNDIISTTGEVFMGMTVGCARCHNHKIDPFLQKDYYSMLSFFHNITPYSQKGQENTILTNVSTTQDKKILAAKKKKLMEESILILNKMKTIESRFETTIKARKSDMRNVSFNFYRETWNQLPNFNMHKAEETGTIESNLFDISGASRKVSFGYVFEGELIVSKSSQYTFLLNSDDGSELFINNESLIKLNGIRHLSKKPFKAHIVLKKGIHKIKLTYFQKESKYGLYLAWKLKEGKDLWPLTAVIGSKKTNFSKLISQKGKEILGEKVYKKYNELEKKYNKLLKLARQPSLAKYVLSVREKNNKIANTFIFRRGNPRAKADKVTPAFPSVLTDIKPKITPRKHTSGARRAFAEWLVTKNPLTARVMVNRIWQYHFGRGIVKTPNNFGNQGARPTHPELLEYLSIRFIENGWSIKKIHKLIMTSSTYRMSSKGNKEYLNKDPENNYFWRYNMRRLTAEELRDSILAVIGKLDLTYGGQSVYPHISKEVLAGQSKNKWSNGPESHQYRRSVYTFQKRTLLSPFIESFDAATSDTSCAVRFTTTLPTQSLTMLNGEFINKSAKLMAKDVIKNAGKNINAQLDYLWFRVTSRKITAKQRYTCTDFLAKMKKLNASNESTLQQLCLIMLNLNEFAYLD